MKWAVLSLLLFTVAVPLRGAILPADTNLTVRETQIIAASQAEAASPPRFNGAEVIGVHPNTPLIYSFAVSGERPLAFSAKHLPRGLRLDPETGIITGSPARAGTHHFTAMARNARGRTSVRIKIACGDTLALTPPMGWNSYDAFGDSVCESEVLSNAEWMQAHLQRFGWDTVVVDFRWYDPSAHGQSGQDPRSVMMDEFGRYVPAPDRFPSATNGAGFGPLAERIHAMGFKFGIHIMRGIPRQAVKENLPIAGSNFTAAQAALPEGDPNRTCVWNRDMFGVDARAPAGRAWYESLARQYAAWGVDYLKCDDMANMFRGRTYEADEIAALSIALKNSGRSIVLSLSPGPAPVDRSAHLEQFANLWRISNDFWDNWKSLNRNFDWFRQWQGHGEAGHWPDGDMIPFGHICQRNCDVHPDRWTRFTRDEQLTLMSLWALAPSPLMLGANLPDNDAWTTALFSNPEVLAVDQDALGYQGKLWGKTESGAEIWSKELADGSLAVGFFNRTDEPVTAQFAWREMGMRGARRVRDLWVRRDLGKQKEFKAELPPHGCALVRVMK